MNRQRQLFISTFGVVDDQKLTSGIWLKWNSLTQTERCVCFIIVLIPIWWLLGWSYLFLLMTICIFAYDVMRKGGLHLQSPSLLVVLALIFSLYKTVFSIHHNPQGFTPRDILSQINSWGCVGLLIWYIQSNNIRVRLQAVAWALSVLVVQMLVFWLVVHFIFRDPYYNPPLSLFGLVTSKSERFIPGAGNGNYLMPYIPGDRAIAGLSRYVFFFPGPEAFALTIGFIGLLALDIKNRTWSLSLFLVSVFLLLISGTRSAWIAFPLVVGIRYLFTLGKTFGPAFLCSLFAVASFTTLSLPAATILISDTLTGTANATNNLRGDSTKVRQKIYQRTFDAIINEPENLILGHGVPGETVLPGYAPAMVGSHSFILGTLLYRSGLLGTGIFVTYWILLILWFYNTRTSRPVCCLLTLVFFSITFATMELELPVMPVTLLCAVLREPTIRFSRKMQHA